MDPRKALNHVGHMIEVASYGPDNDPVNIAVECMDCGEVIVDADIDPDCPRCNERRIPRVGALSRADNKTYICSPCGTHEALQQFANPDHTVTPITDWPVPHYELPQPFNNGNIAVRAIHNA